MFTYFWHQLPFFRILICFISGVLVGVLHIHTVFLPAVCIAFLIPVFGVKDYLKIGIFQDVLRGMGLQFLIFFTGFLNFWVFQFNQDIKFQSFLSCDSLYIEPLQVPVVKPGKAFGQMNCNLHSYANGTVKKNPLQFIRIQVDTQLCSLFPQNGILISRKELKPIPESENYGDFDFKSYAARKNWFFQYRLQNRTGFVLAKLEKEQEGIAANFIQSIRSHLYERYGKNSYSGLMMALLYGEDDEIDKGLLETYAATGTLHILAVSGMHVGLIYWLLGLILNPLKKVKKGKIVHGICILAGVWAYSFVCGMGPSILRATVMVSMMVVSGLIERTYHPLNSLFATAFCLLIFNPYLIADAGFQLSFLAVLGLGLFYQDLYLLWEPNSWLLDQCWKLVSASIAAQICTLPITLYYFHQFPSWFIPANLVIVPLSTLLIYLGLLELLASLFSEMLSAFFAQLVLYLLEFMNSLANWIARWPFAVIQGFWFEPIQWVVFSVGLLFLVLTIYRFRFGVAISLLVSVLIFQTIGLIKDIQQTTGQGWITYSSFGKKIWIWKWGKMACVFLPHDKVVSKGLAEFLARNELSLQRIDFAQADLVRVKAVGGVKEIRFETKRSLNRKRNKSP